MAAKDESKVKETTAKAAHPGTEDADAPDLSSLMEALNGDLTSIDPDAAIAIIDQWQEALKGTKDEDLKEISSGLKELKKLLHGKRTEAAELGDVLTQLGEQTDKVADEAERGTKGPLREVGKALSKAGKSIAKSDAAEAEAAPSSATSADEDEAPDLEELLEVLHDDVTELEPDEAIALIDEWEAALKGTKDEGLKAVNSSLKELKKLLKSSKTEPAQLAEVLTQLGEQTDKAADEAERGTKGPLRDVGKALSKIGKSLEKDA